MSWNDDPRRRFTNNLEYFSRMSTPELGTPPRLEPRPKTPKTPRSRSVRSENKDAKSPPKTPVRKPLHERPSSQHNANLAPTIRLVENDGGKVYAKTPFPHLPSQVLPPRKKAGYKFENRGFRVSDENPATPAVSKPAKSDNVETLVPKPLKARKPARESTATKISDADTLLNDSILSPTSTKFSLGPSAADSPIPEGEPEACGEERPGGVEEEEEPIQKVGDRPTIRAIIPSTASFTETLVSELRNTPEQQRSAFLESPAPTPPPKRERTDSPFPLIAESSSGPAKQASVTDKAAGKRPLPKQSTESLPWSILSYTSSERPRSSSSPPVPVADNIVTLDDGTRIRFPVVRPPSFGSQWEPRVLPKLSGPPPDRPLPQPFSTRLPTATPETEYVSRLTSRRIRGGSTSSRPTRRRQTIASVTSSEGAHQISSDSSAPSSVPVPPPLFSSPRTNLVRRDSDEEREDTIGELRPAPSLKQQRSGYFTKYTDSRPSTARPDSSQSSLVSFVTNSLPPWAQAYYRRGERNSIGAPESTNPSELDLSRSTTTHSQTGHSHSPIDGNLPLSIYRPRNRPYHGWPMLNNGSMMSQETIRTFETEVTDRDIWVFGPPRSHVAEIVTPHLHRDRRSTVRLSAWRAPSFDETFRSNFWSRGNRQIMLFVVGFICPFSWWIASFLPLPETRVFNKESTPTQVDVERAVSLGVGSVEEKRYYKAMWWRNLNRVMSVVGIALVAAIIALAVVASRM